MIIDDCALSFRRATYKSEYTRIIHVAFLLGIIMNEVDSFLPFFLFLFYFSMAEDHVAVSFSYCIKDQTTCLVLKILNIHPASQKREFSLTLMSFKLTGQYPFLGFV